MREQPSISEERLRACLQQQYDLYPVTLEFLPRGRDYSAGVYRVVSQQGAAYLLKVTSRSLYEPSCRVPHYLYDQGITSVVAPIPTKSHALWVRLGDWTAIVYPFIEGDTSLAGMTNEHWNEAGRIFKRIHQVQPPPGGFASLRKEMFDPTDYARWIHDFETQYLKRRHRGSEASRALCASWKAQQSTIHAGLASLERLAQLLKHGALPYVVCHADLHAANLIRDAAGRVFVIDWDEVMLAPKERDFIFVREPQANAFWEGYGQAVIDWVALTYYRWERVVQDLIENAQNVCIRDDLSEATKADIARSFDAAWDMEGGNLAAAYAAAVHL